MPADNTPMSRRRVLIGLGFAGANAAVVRAMATEPDGSSTLTTNPSVASAPTGAGLKAPPKLDTSVPEPVVGQTYDVVLAGGRVIDPASGFDGLANVGISGGQIAAVTTEGMQGIDVVDVSGKVVSPGFVDLLSAEPNGFGDWFKIGDGVTTNLLMHGVNNYANAFFRAFEGKTPLHYGGAFHQHFIRGEDPEIGALPDQVLTERQIADFQALAVKNIRNGFAGVCFSIEYSPGTSADELRALAAAASNFGHHLFFHARYSDPDEPGTSFEAVAEIIGLAEATGLGCHIEHITSTGGTFVMRETIDMINEARSRGLDITACVYPYDYWATTLASFRFEGDWQSRYRISYENLQVAGTEQRLTADTFAQAQRENRLVAAIGSIPEQDVIAALQTDWIMIGSDAILTEDLNNHPRASGTFARVLGRYVREQKVLTLPQALAKMTIMPTQRVETMIPAMRRKGRLQAGADADICVFDPDTIADTATVANPAGLSVGIEHVLSMGAFALRDGKLNRSYTGGQPLRSGAG